MVWVQNGGMNIIPFSKVKMLLTQTIILPIYFTPIPAISELRLQGHKGFRERHRNVHGAFAVNPKRLECLQGKTVVLVDDVYTSGATIRECTKTLLNAGAAAVHVLTLSRVVKPDYALCVVVAEARGTVVRRRDRWCGRLPIGGGRGGHEFILGETGLPWTWEYGAMKFVR